MIEYNFSNSDPDSDYYRGILERESRQNILRGDRKLAPILKVSLFSDSYDDFLSDY